VISTRPNRSRADNPATDAAARSDLFWRCGLRGTLGAAVSATGIDAAVRRKWVDLFARLNMGLSDFVFAKGIHTRMVSTPLYPTVAVAETGHAVSILGSSI
jgi:hypothetical protein